MKGSIKLFIIGIIILLLALFLTTLVETTSWTTEQKDIASLVLLFTGSISVIMGFIES